MLLGTKTCTMALIVGALFTELPPVQRFVGDYRVLSTLYVGCFMCLELFDVTKLYLVLMRFSMFSAVCSCQAASELVSTLCSDNHRKFPVPCSEFVMFHMGSHSLFHSLGFSLSMFSEGVGRCFMFNLQRILQNLNSKSPNGTCKHTTWILICCLSTLIQNSFPDKHNRTSKHDRPCT